MKSDFTQDRSGSDEVGFTAIIKGDADTRFFGILQSFAYIDTAKTGVFHPNHLGTKIFHGEDVANVPGLCLAQGTPLQFQFVVHQKYDLRRSHSKAPMALPSGLLSFANSLRVTIEHGEQRCAKEWTSRQQAAEQRVFLIATQWRVIECQYESTCALD